MILIKEVEYDPKYLEPPQQRFHSMSQAADERRQGL